MLCLSLAGCGFQLRGTKTGPSASIFVSSTEHGSLLVYPLERLLQRQGLLAKRGPANIRLEVGRLKWRKKLLAIDGNVRTQVLHLDVLYRAWNSKGTFLFQNKKMSLSQSYNSVDDALLASEARYEGLKQELLTLAAKRILADVNYQLRLQKLTINK